jgi:hypothetical protein
MNSPPRRRDAEENKTKDFLCALCVLCGNESLFDLEKNDFTTENTEDTEDTEKNQDLKMLFSASASRR